MSQCVACGRDNHNGCDVCDCCRDEMEEADYFQRMQDEQQQEPQPDPEEQ